MQFPVGGQELHFLKRLMRGGRRFHCVEYGYLILLLFGGKGGGRGSGRRRSTFFRVGNIWECASWLGNLRILIRIVAPKMMRKKSRTRGRRIRRAEKGRRERKKELPLRFFPPRVWASGIYFSFLFISQGLGGVTWNINLVFSFLLHHHHRHCAALFSAKKETERNAVWDSGIPINVKTFFLLPTLQLPPLHMSCFSLQKGSTRFRKWHVFLSLLFLWNFNTGIRDRLTINFHTLGFVAL